MKVLRNLTIIFVFSFSFSSFAEVSGKPFSEQAWASIESIYQSILGHPFNVELAKGTLDRKKFQFYKSQDAFYLKKFSKALTLLASKLENPKDIKKILELAESALDENVNQDEINLERISPANFSYTKFLLSTAAFDSREELVAALLPCYWIYLEVAQEIRKISIVNNPYAGWIDLYSSESYKEQVMAVTELANRLFGEADSSAREKMLLAFKVSSRLELEFWDDSYHLKELFP